MQLITELVKCFLKIRPDTQVLVNALAVAGNVKKFSRISPRAKKTKFQCNSSTKSMSKTTSGNNIMTVISYEN